MTPRTNEFIPRTLTVDNRNLKQRAFLLNTEREVFYGGAAAGAKTSGILAAALQYVDVPGYHALLMRRTFKQLAMPGSWIPMAHEWLDGTRARWHTGQKQWTFPSGATLTFGFVGQGQDDVRKYETASFGFIGIDEVTAWREEDYRFLFSRLRRRAGSRVPTRMRCASNPGGRGHEWVKRRFVDPLTRRTTARYLPARLGDNPYVDAEDYIQSLMEQHPTNWRRLLYGDWDVADPGELFQPRDWIADEHYLDESPATVLDRVRFWDFAASEPTSANPDPDYTVGFKQSVIQDGKRRLFVLEHVLRVRQTAGRVEKLVHSTALADGARTRQWMEQEPGASGKSMVDHIKRDVMPAGITMRAVRPRSAKADRWRPWAAAMENGRVRVVRAPWNEPLWDELEACSDDPQQSGAHDDQADAGAGGFDRLEGSRTTTPSIGLVQRGSIRR